MNSRLQNIMNWWIAFRICSYCESSSNRMINVWVGWWLRMSTSLPLVRLLRSPINLWSEEAMGSCLLADEANDMSWTNTPLNTPWSSALPIAFVGEAETFLVSDWTWGLRMANLMSQSQYKLLQWFQNDCFLFWKNWTHQRRERRNVRWRYRWVISRGVNDCRMSIE